MCLLSVRALTHPAHILSLMRLARPPHTTARRARGYTNRDTGAGRMAMVWRECPHACLGEVAMDSPDGVS